MSWTHYCSPSGVYKKILLLFCLCYISRVNILTGLVGFSRLCNGDVFEVQLKLSNQKWKARCRVERQQQVWQDNDVSF